MTGVLDTLAGDAIAGGTALLSGDIGTIIVFAAIVAIVLLIVAAFYKFVGKSRV